MKRSLIALAAFGAMAGAAHAQSSVTLYGVIDTNIEYVNHMSTITPSAANGLATGPGANTFRLTAGGLSSNRWGLRGIEDLGGGLKSVFVLESGFSADDGRSQQAGRLFGRQAYVGLDKQGIGKVTFGRQYTTIFDLFANFSPTGYAVQYEPLTLQLGLNFRSDNVAKYTGTFGGLTTSAYWSFGNGVNPASPGEVAGQFRRDTGYGAGVNYFVGGLGLALVYDQYNPTLNAAGATGTFKKAGAAVSYQLDTLKFMGGYRWGQNEGVNGSSILRDNYYWAGVNWQATGPLSFTLAYYYDDVKNLNIAANGIRNNPVNPWQVVFIADYNFSKRTDVYLSTSFSKNSGLNFDTSAISFANGYFLGTNNNTQLGVALGVRHKF